MLYLTRKVGKKLTIGDDITVQVLGIQNNTVRLGIYAPRDIEIHREEVYLKIKQQREQQIFNEAQASLGDNSVLRELAQKLSPANDANMQCVR